VNKIDFLFCGMFLKDEAVAINILLKQNTDYRDLYL